MYENEKQRSTHLLVLLVYTFLIVALIGESFLMGWDKGAVVLMIIGLAVCWGIHISEKIQASARMWIYFLFSMLACFFYGIHETSVFDLAGLMMVIIILFSFAEKKIFIRLSIATYYITLTYDLLFVLGNSVELSSLVISRICLHVVLVFLAGYLLESMHRIRNNERGNTEKRIMELEEANRRTEDFLANVSHELRTPINAVTGITAVMIKNETDEEKKSKILSIQQAGYRLFDQIEDILDYTETDTGRLIVSENEYILSSVVNDIIVSRRMINKDDAPELIFDIDAGIPSVLLGDEKKIKKILKHLIDNGIKFTKKGGVYVRVYTIHKEYGVNLCIQVRDTGIGIAEEELVRIKDKFYQSSGGRNRKAGGLGLGLSIVCGMVSAMEGFIQIESTVDIGTTVSVSIPQKVANEAPSLAVDKRDELCLACYLKAEKYKVPEVRSFYDQMISHLVGGLGITLYRIYNSEEMKRFMSTYKITHLFLGKEEYEENKSYIESIDHNMRVVVISDDDEILPQGSSVTLIKKPFYALPVVNILNSGANGEGSREGESMICPGLKVLVVDDEPMNLMVTRGILKDYQMDVSTAESGRKAISMCGKEDYDLILLDHMMPEMDGIETLKEIRRLNRKSSKECIIIAFTANAVSGARDMFLQEGFDEFISKPVELMELERVLKKSLPKSSYKYVDKNKKADIIAETVEKRTEQEDSEHGNSVKDELVQDNSVQDNSMMVQLEKAGINTNSGMGYCNRDKDFYIELLTSFVDGANSKESELGNFFEKKDMKNYGIVVHALKSTAKMIGADSLSDNAKQAEAAAKADNLDYITTHHEELMMQYGNIVTSICDALGISVNNDQQKEEAKEEREISKEELISQLKDLKDSLDYFLEEKSLEIVSSMDGEVYPGVSVGEFLKDIRKDVDDYEFVSASKKVSALISQMEGGEF
ncbi:MAG: response regulator [Lachnospira sp.]